MSLHDTFLDFQLWDARRRLPCRAVAVRQYPLARSQDPAIRIFIPLQNSWPVYGYQRAFVWGGWEARCSVRP